MSSDKDIIDIANLIISFISMCSSICIGVLGYNFSSEEKKERYKKEIKDYIELMNEKILIIKSFYFIIYSNFDLYVNELQDYNNFLKELKKEYNKYINKINDISIKINLLYNSESIILFINKNKKYEEYYSKCCKDYIYFYNILEYIIYNENKVNIEKEYFSENMKSIKEYEDNIDKAQKEYLDLFLECKKDNNNNFYYEKIIDKKISNFVKKTK